MQPNAPVGIIGLGLMGSALSERLIDARVPPIGYDIDAGRRERLKEAGGTVARSVRELAERSEVIIVAVYNGEQVAALFGDIENSASARPIMVCMTTCTPDEIIGLSRRAANAGIPFVEAPISGTSA
jgi:3-hydroxyisobutyrate dehydrogenase-like beta-hydroxyacid dehydrogenase